jgi:hypothetical protein
MSDCECNWLLKVTMPALDSFHLSQKEKYFVSLFFEASWSHNRWDATDSERVSCATYLHMNLPMGKSPWQRAHIATSTWIVQGTNRKAAVGEYIDSGGVIRHSHRMSNLRPTLGYKTKSRYHSAWLRGHQNPIHSAGFQRPPFPP